MYVIVLMANNTLVWRETTSVLDSTSVCLKLEAIICTDWIIAKDCLFVPELHRLARDWLGKCHSQLVVSRWFKYICVKPVPSSFDDLRAGNNVPVMFVVLIHVRKMAYGHEPSHRYRHDLDLLLPSQGEAMQADVLRQHLSLMPWGKFRDAMVGTGNTTGPANTGKYMDSNEESSIPFESVVLASQ